MMLFLGDELKAQLLQRLKASWALKGKADGLSLEELVENLYER